MVEYHPISAEDLSLLHQFGPKVLPGMSLLRRSGFENIHLNQGQPRPRRRTRKSSRRIRRVSTTTQDSLPDVGEEKISCHIQGTTFTAIIWTESQTVRAEWRIIPKSTTIHWRDQSNKYDLGCGCWTPHRRSLEYRRKPRPIRFVDWIHTILHIGRETSRWDMERHVRSSATKRKTKMGYRKNRSLTMVEGYEVFTSLIQQMRSSRKLFTMRGESWKFRCQQLCLARSGEESARKLVAPLMFARQNTHASLKSVNLRESGWKELYIKIMKTTLQDK